MSNSFHSLKLPCIASAFLLLATVVGVQAADTEPQDSTLQLGAPFADNAVFQQGIPLPIWGTAKPGSTIEARFAEQTKTATTKADGTWRITLDSLQATKLKNVNEAPVGPFSTSGHDTSSKPN